MYLCWYLQKTAELYEAYVHPWSGGQAMFIEARMYTYMYNLCTNIRPYWHGNSQLQKSWAGQCWWGWKLPEYVSKNDNIYTSCAMQLQLVSKFSWSKQRVKWLPTLMSLLTSPAPPSAPIGPQPLITMETPVPFPHHPYEALSLALEFLRLLIPGRFIYLPVLFEFSAIIRDRTQEGSWGVIDERQGSQCNPN